MSSRAVRGIVVCHGDLARALVDAVREIVGDDGGLLALGTEAFSTEEVERRVEAALGDADAVIVFSDLPSGSCTFAARHLARQREGIGVVCGVNLPLLLDFVFHRELALPDLLERLRGKTGIVIDPLPSAHADRSVPGG